ncbi:MAG: hypothetical protein Kow0045_24690 [Albidovulum sp.]
MVIRTGTPECSPTPLKEMADLMVVCTERPLASPVPGTFLVSVGGKERPGKAQFTLCNGM